MVNSVDGKPAPIGTLMPVLGSLAVVIPLVARILVGCALVIAGALKIRQGSRNVTEAVLGYRLVSGPGAVVVGLALPWLEVGIGVALISDVMPALFYPAAMALLLILTTAVAASLVRGLQNECGCFGARRRQRIRRALVSRNLLLVAPLIGAEAHWRRMRPTMTFDHITLFGRMCVANRAGRNLCGTTLAAGI